MMKPDQERVKVLLTETIALLCKNGLNFEKDVRVQGLLGITVDNKDVFIVQLNENLWLGEDEHITSNDNLPVLSPNTADITTKSPRGRTSLANCDSPSAVSRFVSDKKNSDHSSDAPVSGRGKNKNGKLSSGEKRLANKTEAVGGTSATNNINNSARPVDIKTERLTNVDEDVVFIDDDDVGRDDLKDGYNFMGNNSEKRRQSFDEHCGGFDDLNDFEGNYAHGLVSKRLRRTNSSSERLFSPSSSSATALASRDEAIASNISDADIRVKLEIDPDDGPSGSDEQHFQGYDDIYPNYPWEGTDATSNEYSSTLASDSLYTFPSNNRSFPSRSAGWNNDRKRPSSGHKSLVAGRPLHPPAVFSTSSSASFYGSVFGAGRNIGAGGAIGTGGAGFGGNVSTRFGFTRYKRFNSKTFVCQYSDCGKTFCHSYHLYRHQREKHGSRYDNNQMTRLTDPVSVDQSRFTDPVSVNQSMSPIRQSSTLGLISLNVRQSPVRPVSPGVTTSSHEHQSGLMILPEDQKPVPSFVCFRPGCTHVFCSVAGLPCHLKGNPTQSSEHFANS